eukprot:TRINITY_DN5370_c0_g1_i1.p1 TRINITY_DN5370_c0_g1~~TRINITY_DN5370_c0_g1_i1.p1  ORF type:complete len:495 (-),score=125.53 TRINITY_DN5370_c0_g1_i1:19-1503(-)
MAVWWLLEAAPMPVTSLVPLFAFPVLGIMTSAQIAVKYFNKTSFLFMGTFMLAAAVEKWNLHDRLALKVLISVGNSPIKLLLAFMALASFLSMWLSNTATTALLGPVALQILNNFDHSNREAYDKLCKGLLLAMGYSASVGGSATLTGTGPNLIFTGQMEDLFPNADPIGFAQWMAFAVPIQVVFLFIMWAFFSFRFMRYYKGAVEKTQLEKRYREKGALRYEEIVILVVFATVILAWIFRDLPFGGWAELFQGYRGRYGDDEESTAWKTYVHDMTVVIFGSMVLFLWPTSMTYRKQRARDALCTGSSYNISMGHPDLTILDWKTVEQKMAWGILFLFGGGFALSAGFTASGFSGWIGERLADLVSDLPNYVLLYVVCFFTTILTELASNTATAAILLPVLASTAQSLRINPLFMMVPSTICCSLAFCSPIATPVNALIYGFGYLKISDMTKAGVFMNPIGISLVIGTTFLLGAAIYDIDLEEFPAWAEPAAEA